MSVSIIARGISYVQLHPDGTAERWRDVPGYEGLYRVSDRGRVRSLDRTVWRGSRYKVSLKGKILSTGRRTDKYITINLRGRTTTVHQLVMRVFVGPCPNGLEINHKDGKKWNNRLDNLEYVTKSYNGLHASRLGLTDRRGAKNGRAKVTAEQIEEIQASRHVPARELASRFGVDEQIIRHWWRKKFGARSYRQRSVAVYGGSTYGG